MVTRACVASAIAIAGATVIESEIEAVRDSTMAVECATTVQALSGKPTQVGNPALALRIEVGHRYRSRTTVERNDLHISVTDSPKPGSS